VKQKRQASADFLGVLTFRKMLSAGVAFRQQFWGLCAGGDIRNRKKQRGDMPQDA
jgi:hypothetical protein